MSINFGATKRCQTIVEDQEELSEITLDKSEDIITLRITLISSIPDAGVLEYRTVSYWVDVTVTTTENVVAISSRSSLWELEVQISTRSRAVRCYNSITKSSTKVTVSVCSQDRSRVTDFNSRTVDNTSDISIQWQQSRTTSYLSSSITIESTIGEVSSVILILSNSHTNQNTSSATNIDNSRTSSDRRILDQIIKIPHGSDSQVLDILICLDGFIELAIDVSKSTTNVVTFCCLNSIDVTTNSQVLDNSINDVSDVSLTLRNSDVRVVLQFRITCDDVVVCFSLDELFVRLDEVRSILGVVVNLNAIWVESLQ